MSEASPYIAFWLAVAIFTVAFFYHDDRQEQRSHEITMHELACEQQAVKEK